MTAGTECKNIVVGVDGSAPSEAALTWAANEAALRNIPLSIVYAAPVPTAAWPVAPVPAEYMEWQSQTGREILHEANQLAEKITHFAVPITTEFTVATPASALVGASRSAGMVVVGSRGQGALARTILGSVSTSLVHRAHCPVVVVRQQDPPPSIDAPVLLGFVGSPAAEPAVALAFEESSLRKVKLVALHAWWSPGAFEFPGSAWDDIRTDVDREVSQQLDTWQKRYPEVVLEHIVVADRPAFQIAEHSKSAQLIVVGSHGYGAVASALLGSVSNAVVQAATVPVIVTRPRG